MAEKHSQAGIGKKKTCKDDFIMATNNSSIVSKRAVERLYYPEPHFLRYFVKKPQRRTALINRGYWLRMKAMEYVVEHFLQSKTDKSRIVVNLGCGYDALPFRFLSRQPNLCNDVVFVDVDFPALVKQKCSIISHTDEIKSLLSNVDLNPESCDVELRSDNYIAIGCDLRDLGKLQTALDGVTDLKHATILFVAEVSLTYMDVDFADAIVSWASQLGDARFCLLEQFLPDGFSHPFATTMIEHFGKLNSPLRSIYKYPSLAQQRCRFTNTGWKSVNIESLWHLWSDTSVMTAEERCALDRVEPFDEWEEFALFASHYFLLFASTTEEEAVVLDDFIERSNTQNVRAQPNPEIKTIYHNNPALPSRRRYGAIVPFSSYIVGFQGGLGAKTRESSMDVYTLFDQGSSVDKLALPDIEPRMCHTVTPLAPGVQVLVGGRASPQRALVDCWLHDNNSWSRIDDLPLGRYRHHTAAIKSTSNDGEILGLVVGGGKDSAGCIPDTWLLWTSEAGWKSLVVDGRSPTPRFGASMITVYEFSGILIGGITEDGVVCQDCEVWKISKFDSEPTIQFTKFSLRSDVNSGNVDLLSRFGASLDWSKWGLLLGGGIGVDGVLQQTQEIVKLEWPDLLQLVHSAREDTSNTLACKPFPLFGDDVRRPLLVGHAVSNANPEAYQILGGGAVCFSFGTFWNQGSWTVKDKSTKSDIAWALVAPQSHARTGNTEKTGLVPETKESNTGSQVPSRTSIRHTKIASARDFERVMHEGRPVVLEGLNIGACVQKWTASYLKEAVGAEREVTVHEASGDQLDFQSKNFSYVRKRFGEFVDQINTGEGHEYQYMRAMSTEDPAARATNLADDFPEIANDFVLPSELDVITKNMHSSILRLSGPVQLWLHYDVMANVYCQIREPKRWVLYPPSDIGLLKFPPGMSTSQIDAYNHPPAHTHPYETQLSPGDVLYVPPLWLHTTAPTSGISVGVNVFFKDMKSGYAAGRDVYGNRDIQAYEKGRRDVEKIASMFRRIPPDMKRFYMERLADELRSKAYE